MMRLCFGISLKEADNFNKAFSMDSSAYQTGKVFLLYYFESGKRSGYAV